MWKQVILLTLVPLTHAEPGGKGECVGNELKDETALLQANRQSSIREMAETDSSQYSLLTILSVKCIKPSTGLDSAGLIGLQALGAVAAGGAAVVAGTKVVVLSGGVATTMVVPVTKTALAKAAATGAKLAGDAATFLDGTFSGEDHLVIKVNGQQIVPSSGDYITIKAGETITPNAQISFLGLARVSFIEYDWGSDNDDMGHIQINGSFDYTIPDPALLFSTSEGSVYELLYKVEKGKGDPTKVAGYVMCGTNQCDTCLADECKGHDYHNLDRDKDWDDLKSCPPGFHHLHYEWYPQMWPFADVWLRVCKHDTPPKRKADYVVAPVGDDVCPDGYRPVTDKADCQNIKQFDDEDGAENTVQSFSSYSVCHAHWPSAGCFTWKGHTFMSPCSGTQYGFSVGGHQKLCKSVF